MVAHPPLLRRAARLLAILVAASLACRVPVSEATPTPLRPVTPAVTILPTSTAPAAPTGLPTTTPQPDLLRAALDNISADRLIADVRALSDIQTRHVNSPTINDAAVYIYDQFAASGAKVAFEEFPLTWDGIGTTQRNVSATGDDPTGNQA